MKENILDRDLSVIIKNSAFLREKSDYDDFYVANKKDVERQLADATVFLREIERIVRDKE